MYGEPLPNRWRAQQATETPQLVVHESVHRVKDDGPHSALSELLRFCSRLVGELHQDRKKKGFGLAGPRAGRGQKTAANRIGDDLQRLCLVWIGRIENQAAAGLGSEVRQ